MAQAHKFYLRVTAGSAYNSHEEVHVNSFKPTTISTKDADAEILVQVKDFHAPPGSSAPPSSPYFSHPSRKSARYSISFALVPKRGISADSLLLGNDFDHPIRDQLPPFFGQALHFVKSWIDPGLDGDAYADKPYLFGPMVSSVNTLRIADKGDDAKVNVDENEVIEEGASGSGEQVRKDLSIPDSSSARQKHFLDQEKRKAFTLEEGRKYEADFFNGYLDFNDFALKLPMGLSFSILRELGGENVQPLRYVLKDRETNAVLFHVTFTLVSTEKEDKEPPAEKEEEAAPTANVPETTEDDLD